MLQKVSWREFLKESLEDLRKKFLEELLKAASIYYVAQKSKLVQPPPLFVTLFYIKKKQQFLYNP